MLDFQSRTLQNVMCDSVEMVTNYVKDLLVEELATQGEILTKEYLNEIDIEDLIYSEVDKVENILKDSGIYEIDSENLEKLQGSLIQELERNNKEIVDMAKLNGTEKKTHWAWIGQNATTGSPNPKTGRMSMYGNYAAFSTRKLRDDFVDNFYNQSNPSEYAVKCNIETGRKYSLGMSVWHYEDYMKHVEAYEINERVG